MDQCFKRSSDARIEITKPSISNLNSILVDSKGREETLVSETTSCKTRHVLTMNLPLLIGNSTFTGQSSRMGAGAWSVHVSSPMETIPQNRKLDKAVCLPT